MIPFLVKAKKATYASSEPEDLENGGKRFVFEEGEYRYVDTYFGTEPFIGEEIVFKDGKPVWAMNYVGNTTHYEFLRKAMRAVSEDLPFRGPKHFNEGDYEYVNEVEGGIDFFHGVERIFLKGAQVHICHYHGAKII